MHSFTYLKHFDLCLIPVFVTKKIFSFLNNLTSDKKWSLYDNVEFNNNQTGNIATLDGASLKLVDKFTYPGSSVSSTEKDIYTRLTKAWTAIDRLSIIWKSDLTDKMKRSSFQAAVVLILLYGCTTWTLTRRLEKKLVGNYTRMLRAVLNKSWRQHPTRHQLYGHLPPPSRKLYK